MTVSRLDQVINTTFLRRLSRVTDANKKLASSSGELSGQALYNSLRTGARNFAAGMQMLNASATFVNMSLDVNEKLLDITVKLEEIATKANRGNISPSAARKFRADFDGLAGDFESAIEGASSGADDFLDLTQMEDVLVRSGLDPKKVGELSKSLKRFSHPAETTIDSNGTLATDGNPVPLDEFQRLLRSAIVDDDDPLDERGGFFGRVKSKLKDIRIKLEGNVEALKQTRDLVGDNLKLSRVAGLAFLDVSNQMSGSESAEEIAERIRGKIRAGATSLLAHTKNLETIMVAGYAAVSSQSD